MKTKFVIVFCLFTNLLFGQIGFEHITKKNTWDVILKKSKTENKLIFVDAYAVWCGPCKFMERNIFTHPEVSEYYNQNFINVSVDMETSEGRKFAESYPVTAYPTLLYIGDNGEVLKKKVGAISEPQAFVNVAKWTVNPELDPLTISTKKYNNGNREQSFLIEHIWNLLDNDIPAKKEIQVYLDTVKPLSLTDENTFSVFYLGVDDLNHPLIKEFSSKIDYFSQIYGREAISNKVMSIIQYNVELAVQTKNKKILDQVIEFVNRVFKDAKDVENRKNLITELNAYYKKNAK